MKRTRAERKLEERRITSVTIRRGKPSKVEIVFDRNPKNSILSNIDLSNYPRLRAELEKSDGSIVYHYDPASNRKETNWADYRCLKVLTGLDSELESLRYRFTPKEIRTIQN